MPEGIAFPEHSDNNSTKQKIILLFTKHSALSPLNIFRLLQLQKVRISKQALYKHLRELEAESVLEKYGKLYKITKQFSKNLLKIATKINKNLV